MRDKIENFIDVVKQKVWLAALAVGGLLFQFGMIMSGFSVSLFMGITMLGAAIAFNSIIIGWITDEEND